RRVDAPAGRVPRGARAPVRLLHARDADDRRRPALARPADAGGRYGRALGPDLPLHRLRADRARDPEGRGVMNLAAVLEAAAARADELDAVVQHGGFRLTYAELRERAARLATGLAELGLRRGDRLAAVLDNRHELVELYWAAQWTGAVFVPLSWRSTEEEVAYCIDDAGARLVARAAEDGSVVIGEATFRELLECDERPGAFDLDDRAPSLMLYTSGTTGRPKGVPRSHAADRAGGVSQALQHGLGFGDRTLGVMPLYHTMGMHSLLAMPVVSGCFVCQPRWDPERALQLIERERLTSLYLAPTLYHDLVLHPRRDEFELSSV